MSDILADDDARWNQLQGGYRVACNPLADIKCLQKSPRDPVAWKSLWNELHHQGDVGTASYAVAVRLINMRRSGVVFDWNFYALIACIEVCRFSSGNPPLPQWLEGPYRDAWEAVSALCWQDMQAETQADLLRAYLATLALAKGATNLGQMLIKIDESEIFEWLEEH